jgi:hypothetical protein
MSPDYNSKYVPLRHRRTYGVLEVRLRSFLYSTLGGR